MGAKAASSYQEDGSYFYTCRKDGVERKFMIFSDGEQPNSTKLYEKETDKRNGVTVSVPIKSGDKWEFIQKVQEQLSYFSNVYFEGCNIDNDFKIYRNEMFQYSEMYNGTCLHLTLDDVCYPIDFQKLGIPSINVAIALRFSLTDGLAVIPNRENIEYTKESRKIILDRINKVAEHLITQYNDKSSLFDNVKDLFDFYNCSQEYYVKLSDTISIKVKPFSSYTNVPFNKARLKGVIELDTETLFFKRTKLLNLYKVTSKISNGRFSKEVNNEYHYNSNFWYNIINSRQGSWEPIIYKELPSGKKLAYLKSVYKNAGLFRKTKDWKLNKKGNDTDNCLTTILELYKYPKDKWRQVIKDWLYIVDIFVNKATNEENIVIPQSWVDANKVARVVTKKLDGEVNFKFARNAEKSSMGDCVFESSVTKLKSSTIKGKLIIYGDESSKDKLGQAFKLNNNSSIKIALLGKNDYKKIKELNHYNFMDIKDVESTYNKVILNYVTAWKVCQFVTKYEKVFKYREALKGVSEQFYQDLTELYNFQKSNQVVNNALLQACVKLCEENNWKCHHMDAIINRVSKNIDKVDFLHFFANSSGYYSSGSSLKEGSLNIIKELLLARKFKMDYLNYVKPPTLSEDETNPDDIQTSNDEPEPELEFDGIDLLTQTTI